ncbi:MAG: glycosyltransferase family 4 protein [Chloroflexi bacterium]|nr:glycosyltransferase family 4 protein [Chloroflexota bacterium]
MPGKLRVLHVVRRYAPLLGGTERLVRDLAHEARRRGHAVRVVTLRRDVVGVVPGELSARWDDDGVEVIRLPGAGNRRLAVTFRPDRLGRAIRDADVVHLHDLRFGFVLGSLFATGLRRPVLLHTHGLIFHTPWAGSLKRLAVRGLFGPLLRIAGARIIAGSDPDRDALVELAPYLAPRTHTFENAIDLSRVQSITRSPEAGLVVLLGRVAPSKGIGDALRALSRVRVPWHLEIAGPIEPGEGARLEAVATRLGIADRVALAGPYDDGAEATYLSRAAVSIFPSPGEGFGLALLEAMAAGVPVIANRIPAHASLLGPPLAAQLVRFDDPEEVARGIEAQLTLTPEVSVEIARLGRARAERFGIGRLADQIDGLYAELGLR